MYVGTNALLLELSICLQTDALRLLDVQVLVELLRWPAILVVCTSALEFQPPSPLPQPLHSILNKT